MKKTINLFTTAVAALLGVGILSSCTSKGDTNYLKRDDWNTNVKNNLNKFIERNKNSNKYVVFDFDNTSSIFDVEEQSIIYQVKHMAFNMTPDQLPSVLSTDLDVNKTFTNGTYKDWIDDIAASYEKLYNDPNYGPFTYQGLSQEKMTQIQEEDEWKNFAAKLRELYNVVGDFESTNVSYPWVTYLFTGMTIEETYQVGKASHSSYKDVETNKETITSPNIGIGSVATSFTNGISVSANIAELMKALSENGIDVWVCSASNIDLIRAAVDTFGLHDYVTGVLAMSNKQSSGKMINEYDYNAKGYLAKANNAWEKDTYAFSAQTQGKGKVTAISNALVARYGKGPSAGFMDSTGDFNFCTEYKSLELVTCFNRANRGITDGGGLIAAVAIYQQDTLKWDLDDALEFQDTLYLLQGREENGLRGFRNSNKTIRLGETEETLFKNQDNFTLLNYLVNSNKSIKEYIDMFAVKTAADDTNNPINLKYGCVSTYDGYHSI